MTYDSSLSYAATRWTEPINECFKSKKPTKHCYKEPSTYMTESMLTRK